MRLKLLCTGCRRNVSGSRKAVIHIRHADALAAEQHTLQEAWEIVDQKKRGEFPKSMTLAELLDQRGPEARWEIHCDDCNPHWNENRTEACGGCYWWSLDRCSTAEELLHWTAHLHQTKSWFASTNWDKFIYGILGKE